MALFYHFGELDKQLGELESAQTAQEGVLSSTARMVPGLDSGVRDAARRALAIEPTCDLSGYIAPVLGWFRRREAVSRRVLAGRSRRLKVMRWSLCWAIRWGVVRRWFERVRNG